MNASAIQADLARFETCSMAVRNWFAENDLLLNAGKAEVMFLSTSFKLGAMSAVSQVPVTGSALQPPSELKCQSYVAAVSKACNLHICALRHFCRLL
jgi:hypothetical protein